MTTFTAISTATALNLRAITHFSLSPATMRMNGLARAVVKQASTKKNNVVDGASHPHAVATVAKAASSRTTKAALHGAARATMNAVLAKNNASMKLSYMSLTASNKPYATSSMYSLPLSLSAGQNTVVSNYAIATMATPGLTMSTHMVTGSRGTGSMALEQLSLMAANKPYATAAMSTLKMGMYAAYTPVQLMLSSATMAQNVSATATLNVLFVSGASVLDAWVQYGLSNYTTTEHLTAGSSVSALARYSLILQDNLYAAGVAQLFNQTYDCLVVNTNTNAVSMYAGYAFNSFAKIGETYYGAASDGLYALAGDTDAGAMILSSVLALGTRADSAQQKNVPTAYIGLKASGVMQLNVTTENNETQQYTLTQHDGGSVRNERVVMAKGARGAYWQFELANPDGQDFTLDYIEILPVILTRRV